MTLLWYPTAFLLAAALCRLLTGRLERLAVPDLPNDRSLHARPTPRGGGIAILTAFFVTLSVSRYGAAFPAAAWPLAAGAGLLAVVSYLDDRRGLSVRVRLPVHLVAAAIPVALGLFPEQWPVAGAVIAPPLAVTALLALLSTVWLTNLYNFMDGMDGFAGGMGVSGFFFLGCLAGMRGAPELAHVALLLAAACLGFLVLNFPPARIFMGDVGSAPLGFLAAGLSLWGVRDGVFPPAAPLLIFSPFIVDATATLLHRALRGEKVWQAHRSHYYQRLVLAGWSHRRTVLAEYTLMLAAGLTALAVAASEKVAVTVGSLLAWIVIYGILMRFVNRRAPMP